MSVTKAVANQVRKGMSQVRHAFLGLVAIGGGRTLQLKGFDGETLDGVELYQHVGFASHIPNDAKVVLIPLQGKTAKSVVVATQGGNIVIDVANGETCIYDQHGHSVWLKADGTHIEGDLFVNGQVHDQKGSMQAIRDIYNQHNHGNSPPPNQQME